MKFEKIRSKIAGNRFIAMGLALAMVLGMLPAFQLTAFASTNAIAALPIGTEVMIPMDEETYGKAYETFIVINQGIPGGSSAYSANCNGTWLMMKDLYVGESTDSLTCITLR